MATISNYKELKQEKVRLAALLEEQKLQIREDWQSIKDDIKPSFLLASTMKKAFTRKASGAFTNLGINLIADGLFKKVLLARSGRLSRWIIPFLVKNYASHLVDDPEKLIQKIKNFFLGKSNTVQTTVTPQPVHSVTPQEAGIEAV
jgi:hypothetical protein